MKQELGSPSLGDQSGEALLWNTFRGTYQPKFKACVVEAFAVHKDERLIERRSSMQELFVAVEAIQNQLYYVFSHKNMQVWQWGEPHHNFFFGLEQSFHINFFESPTAKVNLLLCDNVVDVMTFLCFGIPAIMVDSSTFWNNAYFQNIVQPTFPNIIVTFRMEAVPSAILNGLAFKFFDVRQFLVDEKWPDDLFFYCQYTQWNDDFLEPLWNLFEYIDDDSLLPPEILLNKFSIQY